MSNVTAHCLIRNNRFTSNGQLIFEKEGSLDTFLEAAYLSLNAAYPRFYKMDRMGKLGFLASEVLLSGRGYSPSSVAVVLSNAHASMDTDLRYFESTRSFASPSLFVYTLPNIVAGEICIRHGIKGENTFFISPAFDAELIVDYVERVLSQNHTSACVAGWVEVLHDDAEVFLYLAEKTAGNAVEHNTKNILSLYKAWNS